MMKKSLGLIAATSVCLSGCGLFGDSFRDRANDYQLAEEDEVIEIPANFSQDVVGEIYAIPSIPDDSLIPGEFETPRPQRPSDTAFEKQVKIQTLADKRWALVQASPSEVWPEVRNVLSRNAIPAATTDAPRGVMETVWVNFKDDEDNSHRFRVSIEPGVQFNTTEVSVLQNQSPKGEETKSDWSEESADSAREKEMLTMLAEALSGDLSSSSVSLLAQSIGGEAKVEVLTPKAATPFIRIKLNMDRSWASVVYSASRGGFSIIDQDRSDGMLYLNYVDEEEEGGFFSGWFGGDDEESKRRVDFHVKMNESDQGIEVRIYNPEDGELEPLDALKLLKLLRSNLS